MVASTQISDYIAAGTLASRPTTPNVASGVSSLYYATDTGDTYMWDGSAWHKIDVSGSINIVQTAVACGGAINGATFGAAPTQGNLLLAILGGAAPSANTGWTGLWTDGGGTTFTECFWKIAGASEPTLQRPFSNATLGGGLVIWELTGLTPGDGKSFQDTTSTTHTVTPMAFKTTNLIVGLLYNEAGSSSAYPTGFTPAGVTIDGQANDVTNNRAVTGFHLASPTVGSNSIVGTLAASTNCRMAALSIGG